MATKIKVLDSKDWHVVTTYAGDITKVDMYHLDTGIHARGNAKRHSSDTYSAIIGEKIARYRALERISAKLLEKQIKGLSR